jgi:hypothetical protein
VEIVAPVVIALLFIGATSMFTESHRPHFMAIMLAGAGAAYLNGGLGLWECAFAVVVTFCAYQGLHSHRFLGLGWLLHTMWDVLHHLYGNPIVPFSATSSLGCAICDPVIAAWCFADAPAVSDLWRRKRLDACQPGLRREEASLSWWR